MEITIENWQRLRSHVENSRYAVVRLGDNFVIGRYLLARDVARELKRRSVLGDQLRRQLHPYGI
jgi:hypothetical protein